MIEGFFFDDEAVVTCCSEGVWHVFEDGFAVVVHEASFAMHETIVADDGHAE